MSEPKYLKGSCQQCGGRIEYPALAIGTIVDCPHCHQATELLLEVIEHEPQRLRHGWIVWALVGVIVLGLLGALAPLILKRLAAKHRQERPATEWRPAYFNAAAPGFVTRAVLTARDRLGARLNGPHQPHGFLFSNRAASILAAADLRPGLAPGRGQSAPLIVGAEMGRQAPALSRQTPKKPTRLRAEIASISPPNVRPPKSNATASIHRPAG